MVTQVVVERMVDREELAAFCGDLLQVSKQRDYCPNGLQVAGKQDISKIVTGVTASLATIEAAEQAGADALLVHHGYFWKGEDQCLVGAKYQRIKALIDNEISLFAYHLPLDVHPELGNNAQLGELLGFGYGQPIGPADNPELVRRADLSSVFSVEDLQTKLRSSLAREPLVISGGDMAVNSIAWCTGGAQDYIELAAASGADAYISGEASERTFHAAKELGIHYFAAGHHATERYGVQALGSHISNKFGVDHEFIDIDNPV